ncbi:hypothetical protein [Pseudoduganella violacea]|uniref:Uncharacterized protein n=1 Tax=Pseudoduganella violacea TaxID=1715466 RepID=A0A7W5FSF7_9BURK|nr:hypothetical protein [Pseudoduganella violacea]MBB3117709.1 hypothetical protein [Pseudoduganella violacea]
MKLLTAMILAVGVLAWATAEPLPEAQRSAIEYRSVAEALAGLRGKPDTRIGMQGTWIIAHELTLYVLWSFVPEEHPAYPAVIKRAFVAEDGEIQMKMGILCEAGKGACDALRRDAIEQDEKLRAREQSSGR